MLPMNTNCGQNAYRAVRASREARLCGHSRRAVRYTQMTLRVLIRAPKARPARNASKVCCSSPVG
jgi:hypothetical protein